jgi:hypothetical protein
LSNTPQAKAKRARILVMFRMFCLFLVLSDNLQQWNRYQSRRRVCGPSSKKILQFSDSLQIDSAKKRMSEVEEAVGKLKSQAWKIQVERVPKPF